VSDAPRSTARSTAPILITGAHRTATRWVSQALAASPDGIAWIWEPFSPKHRLGTFAVPFRYYYHAVTPDEEPRFAAAMSDTLAFRYRAGAELTTVRSARDLGRLMRDWRIFNQRRRVKTIPLLKDPIALFSAEWIAREFDARVGLTVRHPAAFCASLVHRKWRHDFNGFVTQPELMETRLARWADDIRRHAAEQQSLLDEAILLWNLLNDEIHRLRTEHPDWAVMRQEDLSRDPLHHFRLLFDKLDVTWSESVEQYLYESSGAQNKALDDDPSSDRRHSSEHMWNWTRQLTAEQISKVRRETDEVSSRFYGAEDWERRPTHV
jgi:hypothetical protein